MRIIIFLVLSALFFTGCNKDKYTTSPQIKYKSVSPNFIDDQNQIGIGPQVTLSVTDAEGDLGITADDTAYIYLKNLLTDQTDSLPFPDLKDVSKNNFKGDIIVAIGRVSACRTGLGSHIDTTFFEIYVKDFSKNASNTIVTGDPIFHQCE